MSDDAPNTKLDSVEQFATDLRDLRLQAGNPTLGALHTRTQISKSVLSEALSGRKLPTERTVASLAEALGADRGMWIARRNALDPRTPVTLLTGPDWRVLIGIVGQPPWHGVLPLSIQ